MGEGLEEKIKPYLDKIAESIERDLKRYFPDLKFKFTHEEFSIFKKTITIRIEDGFPLVGYNPVKDISELTPNSYLLIIASVLAFGRKQTAQVRCIIAKEDGLVLQRTDEPVEILDTEYFAEEEDEKKERGLIRISKWVSNYQHEIVGALITIALNIAFKQLGL